MSKIGRYYSKVVFRRLYRVPAALISPYYAVYIIYVLIYSEVLSIIKVTVF